MSLLENAYALLIGIEYEDGLDTRGDAEDLAEILTDPSLCGYPPDQVTLLLGEEADRNGILGALDHLIETTDEKASVFLFYSGHGDVLEGTFHFVPYGIKEGMDYEAYTESWVTAEEIRERINRLATRRLIFFMDCCHATGIAAAGFSPRKEAAVTGGMGPGKQAAFDRLEGLAQKVDNEKGISIVASCKEEQESYQLEGDKNSVFTKFLLKALRGEHQSEFHDPFVRILEVAGYLLREVPETIQQVANACDPPLEIRQEPYVNLEMYDNFILSYIPESLRKSMDGTRAGKTGDAGAASGIGPGNPSERNEPSPAPRDKNPNWSFREDEGANNLILFIHGFTGESRETFGNLPELLMEDSEFQGWDMKPFGYSKFIQPEHGKHVWGGIRDIHRIVDYLCTSVRYKFEKYDRIAIVAHGLGGLIAQRALLDFEAEYRQKVTHLILLACPSEGIPTGAESQEWKSDYAEIGQDAPFIRSLREDWERVFEGAYPFQLCVAAATEDAFVDTASCFSSFPKTSCHLLQADHFSLVKPENETDEVYRLVRHQLTHSDFFRDFSDPRERNLALGKFEAVVRDLLPEAEQLDATGLKTLVFALEGLDRRQEAMDLLEQHPALEGSSDLMGIIGGRYKRAYLKKPTRKSGEAAQVYYSLALEAAEASQDPGQIYYHSINLALLNLLVEEDRQAMVTHAQRALEAAEKTEDSLWKSATLAEASLYLGDREAACRHYERAAAQASPREKISMHLNASAANAALTGDTKEKNKFRDFLDRVLLA